MSDADPMPKGGQFSKAHRTTFTSTSWSFVCDGMPPVEFFVVGDGKFRWWQKPLWALLSPFLAAFLGGLVTYCLTH